MRAIFITALLAVLTTVGDARTLHQDEQVFATAARPSQNNGRRGSLFKFKKNKNAEKEFERVEKEFPGLLERAMRNSNYMGDRSRLARELEGDDDMVRLRKLFLYKSTLFYLQASAAGCHCQR